MPLHTLAERRFFRMICPPERRSALAELLKQEGYGLATHPAHPELGAADETAAGKPLGASLAAQFGLLYIQDAASFIAPLALAPEPGEAVLDMCASPGGKSTFLAQLAGQGGLVVANEPNPQRLATLRQNVARLGLPQVVTLHGHGEKLPLRDASFPAILLDPPCSGWGTAEKHPKVATLWTGDKVAPLVALQRQLLEEAARLLAPGGRLVYSTCTTNPEENELQALHAAASLGLSLSPLPPTPGFVFEEPAHPDAVGTLRVAAAASRTQGHFIALLTKPGGRLPADTARSGVGVAAELPSDDIHAENALAAMIAKGGRLLPPDATPHADLLPPGAVVAFKETARFLPARALQLLPTQARWQGLALGKMAGGEVRPAPRCRTLVPPAQTLAPGDAIVVEDAEPLRDLLAGRGVVLSQPVDAKALPLYYRDLPLGWVTVKKRRVLWTGA